MALAHELVIPGGKGLPKVEIYRGIKLLLLDVDGVLTDGQVHFDANGVETKVFDIQDGTGMTIARLAGLKQAIISGRNSKVTEVRAEELKIPLDLVCQGAKRKLPVFLELLKRCGVGAHETAFVGDDIIDLPVLERTGLSFCPANARVEVKQICHGVSHTSGGHGAVRDICEHLLKGRADGSWERAVKTYLGTEDPVQ